jgi:hypothetical protein
MMGLRKILILAVSFIGITAGFSAQTGIVSKSDAKTILFTLEFPATNASISMTMDEFNASAGKSNPPIGKTINERKKHLQDMINLYLIELHLRETGYYVSFESIERRYRELKGKTLPYIDSTVAKAYHGFSAFYPYFDEAAFLSESRDSSDMARFIMMERYLTTIKFDEGSIPRPAYDEVGRFRSQKEKTLLRPEAVRLSIIFLRHDDRNAASRAAILKRANDLYSEARGNPAAFAKIVADAKDGGTDYAASGGYYFARTDEFKSLFGEQFYLNALSLKKGDISSLLIGPNGYHILMAEETYPEKFLELTDPITLGEEGTVYEYLEKLLFKGKVYKAKQSIVDSLLADLKRTAKISVNEGLLGK